MVPPATAFPGCVGCCDVGSEGVLFLRSGTPAGNDIANCTQLPCMVWLGAGSCRRGNGFPPGDTVLTKH